MIDVATQAPDNTAVRTALWRALHVEVDAAPPVFADVVGLQLAAPENGWRDRGDMHPEGTRGFRASIVSRARFVEDLVVEQAAAGVAQYVILGAGLDSLAQRRTDLADQITVFEVDQPGTQAWKRRRLEETGLGVPDHLRLVPIDFEGGESWWDGLLAAGFDPARPAIVSSTGVSMYLTKHTTAATLRQLATLAPGSTVAMTFFILPELVDEADRPGLEIELRRGGPLGHPVRQLLRPRRDRGHGAGRRLPGGDPSRIRRAGYSLLRRPPRRPAPVHRRGPPHRGDVADRLRNRSRQPKASCALHRESRPWRR